MRSYLPYQMLLRNSTLFRNHKCLYDGNLNHSFTFLEILDETEQLAAGLKKLGLKQGDRIGVISKNTYRFFPLFFAASKLGLILVLINKRLSPEEKKFIALDTTPSYFFIDNEEIEISSEIKKENPSVKEIFLLTGDKGSIKSYTELLVAKDPHSEIHANEDDPYIIIHTAAVDGKPRGGVLSQKNIVLSSLQIAFELSLSESDAYLNILPLFHIMGINLAFSTYLCGGKNVVIPSFDRELSARLMNDEKITLLGTFPPILQSLLDTMKKLNLKPNFLKKAVGLEQKEIIERLETETSAEFWWMYGQTETSGLICLGRDRDRPGAAGRPLALSDVFIVDEDDRKLPPGEVGEIALKGPLVFLGYWNRDDDNKYVFRNDIHHTGDLAMMDEDGYLFFKGRKPEKELIKSGGENVFPAEVEEVIMQHPDIIEVCVIGVPDPKFGEGIGAVCVKEKNSTLTKDELIEFVGSRIARYKKPRYVLFTDTLPKDKNGKIDRQKVKEKFIENLKNF
ncbi:AMP-binding protein [Desulfothermus sp.]